MLNRRHARVRVMQSLYALEKAKGANFLMANDLIAESFAPDLNSMERQDKTKLAGLLKLTQTLFQEEANGVDSAKDEENPVVVETALSKAREFLKLKNQKDLVFQKNNLKVQAEKTYEVYLYLLNILMALGEKSGSVLVNNKVIQALAVNKDLELMSTQKSVSLEDDSSFINKLYNEAVKSNEHMLNYVKIVNKTGDDDLAIVKYLVKNILLKHEICDSFFERKYSYWEEDTEILRTMVFHSFNDFLLSQTVEIEKPDERWEETKSFLCDLFADVSSHDEEYLKIILPHLKNWQVDRIIETDMILMKMAVSELMNFSGIPVKVTMNEIIEISKNYSSEKSKVFINGVLESLFKDLNQKGLIKKSGRGMLDK